MVLGGEERARTVAWLPAFRHAVVARGDAVAGRVDGGEVRTRHDCYGCKPASFEVERCDPEIFDYLCNEAMLDTSRHALFFSFATANRMALPAVSLIHFESRTNGLSIHTFHSFPTERAIVRTHSLFESRLALPAR